MNSTYTDKVQLLLRVLPTIMEEDCRFLISFEQGTPDWEHSKFKEFQQYPSVQWKLQNLHKLQQSNSHKLQHQVERLRKLVL